MHSLFHPNLMDSELGKLHIACQEWGFFQLINHGVDSIAIETMKLEIHKFFNLPVEEKRVMGKTSSFQTTKSLTGLTFFTVTLPTYLRKPHLIPKLPPSFRDAIEAYASELKILAMKILSQMAKTLSMKFEDMERLFEEGMQLMRMNYYPPCPQPELVTGLCPHSDAAGLTILLQVNEMEGLQIKKEGVWIPVSPLPNALVINIGDSLEIATNGIYRSIEHRATVNAEKERISVATFLSPKLDGDLGPAPSLITSGNQAKFKRIDVADFFRGYFSRELKGKSYIDTMGI